MNELLQEVLHEITGRPLVFAAEIVHFVLLILIVQMLLHRTVGKRLRERRERIIAEIDRANRADEDYADAEQQAATLVADARARAQRVIEAAQAAAHEHHQSGIEQAERDAEAIISQAKQTIETEKERVTREAADRLTDLITRATRRFIDEALTEDERRTMTQKLILTRLKGVEGASPKE
jgi:F-type H+-transporting ATPase subunit b